MDQFVFMISEKFNRVSLLYRVRPTPSSLRIRRQRLVTTVREISLTTAHGLFPLYLLSRPRHLHRHPVYYLLFLLRRRGFLGHAAATVRAAEVESLSPTADGTEPTWRQRFKEIK